jgi:hypothetical protein
LIRARQLELLLSRGAREQNDRPEARRFGVGIPPYHAMPEPSELERVHRPVGLALFAVAALAATLLASAFVFLILGRYRSRDS